MKHVGRGRAGPGDDEIRVKRGNLSCAVTSPFQTGLIDQCAGGLERRILKDAPCAVVGERLSLLLSRQVLLKGSSHSNGIVHGEVERGTQNDTTIINVRMAIPKTDPRLVPRFNSSLRSEHRDRFDDVAHFSGGTSCIHPDCAADGRGNSRQGFEPGKAFAAALSNKGHEIDAGPNLKLISVSDGLAKSGSVESHYDAIEAVVRNQDVGPPAQHFDCDIRIGGASQKC